MGETKQSRIRDLDTEIDVLSDEKRALESEILLLEERIEQQRESLQAKSSNDPSDKDGGIYVFDEEDKTAASFDKFFAKTDPELDKIRDDLLKDSRSKRRFSVLPARLGG